VVVSLGEGEREGRVGGGMGRFSEPQVFFRRLMIGRANVHFNNRATEGAGSQGGG
jgi:hypothetical protein